MKNRNKKIRKEIYFSEDEMTIIRNKMALMGTDNFSAYARKMLCDGYVVKQDFSNIKELTRELANLARNINQIAKRANETRSIYEQDIKDLREYYFQVKKVTESKLIKIMETKI